MMSASGATESAGGVVAMEAPSINWWRWSGHAPPLGWQWVNFAIFLLILFAFLRRPLQRVFLRRHTSIKQAVAAADAALAEARRSQAERRHKLAQVQAEGAALVEAALQAGARQAELEAQAAQEANARLQAEAAAALAQEASDARRRLTREAVGQALQEARAALRSQLSAADGRRLVDAAVTELANLPSTTGGGFG